MQSNVTFYQFEYHAQSVEVTRLDRIHSSFGNLTRQNGVTRSITVHRVCCMSMLKDNVILMSLIKRDVEQQRLSHGDFPKGNQKKQKRLGLMEFKGEKKTKQITIERIKG